MNKIGRASYYKWLNSYENERDKENKIVLDEIIKLYSEVKGIYGYLRITLNINRIFNSSYNHKRIYRLMRSVKLAVVI
ncbi:IS3 family transposase [Clostridioides difficile]